MITTKTMAAAAFVTLVLFASGAHALPVIVPNFAVDPSGPEFTIQAVSATDPNSNNLAGDPILEFAVTSVPDGTDNTLRMTWEQATPDLEAQAGWELVFGTDPDLRNQKITLSINPPGNFVGPLFQGIVSVSVIAVDFGGNVAGGWGFNTDLAGALAVANDPLALGLSSLQSNVMHNVTINIGLAPVAGSATITPLGGFPGPFTGPNFLIGGNNNFANIQKLQFFENGILQAGVNVIPGQPIPGLLNYWNSVAVTPEPSTGLLLGSGLLVLLAVKRRRRPQ